MKENPEIYSQYKPMEKKEKIKEDRSSSSKIFYNKFYEKLFILKTVLFNIREAVFSRE